MNFAISMKIKKKSPAICNMIFLIYICQRLNPDFQSITWLYSATPILLTLIMSYYIIFVDKTNFTNVLKNWYIKWILGFTVLCLVSFSWSLVPAWDSLNFFIINLSLMIPMALYLNNMNRINGFIKIIVFACAFTSLYILLFSDISVVSVEGASRLAGDDETWNANAIGIMSSLAVILSLYLNKTFNNKIYIAIIILCVSVALMTGSRKTLIILVVGSALYYVFSAKRSKFLYAILMIIGIIFAYYLAMSVPDLYNSFGVRIEGLIGLFNNDYYVDSSTRLRINMIENGWIWFKQNPFLGVGIDNYRYQWESLYGYAMYAHNNYIEILVDLGIIGAVIYYSIYISSIQKLMKSLRQYRYLSAVALSILLTIAFVEISLVSYNYRLIQTILCLVFSIVQIAQKNINLS